MRKIVLQFILGVAAVVLMLSSTAFAQGTTTASVSGTVLGKDGTPLVGATVIAVHTPTGTRYGVLTRDGGQFNLPNVRVGGPYTVTSTYVGYEEAKREGIYLSLGSQKKVSLSMVEAGVTVEEVLIVASAGALGTEQTGAETNIGEKQISELPTVSRDISDFTRLTPQATLTEDGDGELGFSVAGQNNRFNSIYIDGAISNDVFGLSDQGTNGGQAGISPISIDAIEQFNIVVSPFDVTIGGFTGAGVNAVTRSGSNKVQASAYYFLRNQALAGKTPTDNELDASSNPNGVERVALPDFSAQTVGFRVGGPILKDKIFFFVNAELERRETPLPFDFADYIGASTQEQINAFSDRLMNVYGYDAGGYLNNVKRNDGEKILAKLDFNLNDNNKLTLRHSYAKGRAEKANPSDNDNINFQNRYEYFPSTTNSTAIELNSVIGDNMANSLIFGRTSVRDDRDPLGDPFPQIVIADGDADIIAGSEPFSTANNLEQDIYTVTNNFNLYAGKHSFTFGIHNEFYSVLNLFVRQNYGVYEYASLNDFMNDAQPDLYIRGYSIREGDGNAVGDDITEAAANFNATQVGFYAQDEFKPSDKFSLTYGLRVDIPIFLDEPEEDTYFNQTALPELEKVRDLKGARAGQLPSPQIMLGPRLGFRFDPNGDGVTQIRGGIGLFTSRLPLVWPGGSFTNNGINAGGVFEFSPTLENGDPITFQGDINNQYTAADFGNSDPRPSGQMDLFAEDLKYPQVFRGSAAIDRKLPWGVYGSLEAIFTKNINSVVYRNVNLKPATETLDGVDNRPYFDRGDEIDDTYGRILLGENTSEGYTFNFTASLTKAFENGFAGSIAYNYGYAEAVNDLTSSQNSSQWRNLEVVNGKNAPVLSRSDFSMGSRVVAALSYKLEYADHLATTISLYYNGQSGEVFSYTYGGGRADRLTNQDSRDFTDLIYIPRSASDIEFTDQATAAQQWADLDAFIEQDPYLSKRREEYDPDRPETAYAERNGARTPATHIVDLKLIQDIFTDIGNTKHKLQVTFDVFNFTNMLNKNWGRRYRANFNGIELIQYDAFDDRGAGPLTPTFTYNPQKDVDGNITTKARLAIDDVGTLSSRWQAQLGIRYIFN